MTWNNRVMMHKNNYENKVDGLYYYEIHEVFYNKKGEIFAWTSEPVEPHGRTLKELKEHIEMLAKACKAPILSFNMKPEGKIS